MAKFIYFSVISEHMRRKIIKQGTATLTISLPAKWTKKFNLKAGDEIELEEQGQHLTLSTAKAAGALKAVVDLTRSPHIAKAVINATYVKGSDEIELGVANREQAKRIQGIIRGLQGLEIVGQTKNTLFVKDMTAGTLDLEPLVRRIFHMVLNAGQEALDAFKAKETDLGYLEDMEESINRVTNLCLRVLNKQGADSHAKMTGLYTFCFLLEAIADEMKELLKFIRTHKVTLSADIIAIYTSLLNYLKQLEDVAYMFGPEKANNMGKTYESILVTIHSKLVRKSKEETVVLMYFKNILEFAIWAMNQHLLLS